MTTDHAGVGFWDEAWEGKAPPRVVDPDAPGMRNYPRARLCGLLERELADVLPGKLLEVGCANSAWLPWYHTGLKAEVWGLDYSEPGCRQAEAVLARAGVPGTIVLGDLFDPPEELIGAFDAIVSWGVVEHFDDTAAALAALAKMLAPGGRMVTLIPNMAGATGWLAKVTNRPVFDTHQVLDREDFAAAHQRAGLDVQWLDYFMSAHAGVINLEGAPVGRARAMAQKVAVAGLARLTWALWAVQRRTGWEPVTARWSPYVISVAGNPEPPAA